MTRDSLELAEKWKARLGGREGWSAASALTDVLYAPVYDAMGSSSKIQFYVSVLMFRSHVNPYWSIEHCIERQGSAMLSMQKSFSASTWMRSKSPTKSCSALQYSPLLARISRYLPRSRQRNSTKGHIVVGRWSDQTEVGKRKRARHSYIVRCAKSFFR